MAVEQALEKVQYVERNLEECDSLNRDEMWQRLITLNDEEYYKIMVSNRPWVTDDQSIVPKPTFFFGDAVPDDSTYQRRCFQFSYTADGEERTVSTRSTFDRTILIMSLFSTCSKREDPPCWGEEDQRDQDRDFCWRPFRICGEVAFPFGHADAGQRLPRF